MCILQVVLFLVIRLYKKDVCLPGVWVLLQCSLCKKLDGVFITGGEVNSEVLKVSELLDQFKRHLS